MNFFNFVIFILFIYFKKFKFFKFILLLLFFLLLLLLYLILFFLNSYFRAFNLSQPFSTTTICRNTCHKTVPYSHKNIFGKQIFCRFLQTTTDKPTKTTNQGKEKKEKERKKGNKRGGGEGAFE